MNSQDKDISTWMKEKRRELNLSQKDFAKILGVSTAAVVKWEDGTRNAKLKTIRKFEDILRMHATGEQPVSVQMEKDQLTVDVANIDHLTNDEIAKKAGKILEVALNRIFSLMLTASMAPSARNA